MKCDYCWRKAKRVIILRIPNPFAIGSFTAFRTEFRKVCRRHTDVEFAEAPPSSSTLRRAENR